MTDATKGATPKNTSDKVDFWVFGTETISGTPSPVFGGSYVSYNNSLGVWRYSPLQFWDNNASEYEFLGVSGPASNSSYSFTPSPLAATFTYSASPASSQYDLMGACDDRVRNAQGLYVGDPVELSFEHLLSAVSVVVYNDSPQQHVLLVGYCFRNLYYRSDVEISYHVSKHPSSLWKDATKVKDTSNPLLGWTPNGTDGRELNPNTHAPLYTEEDAAALGEGETLEGLNWDMMIPQTLNPLSMAPLLMVKYCLVDYSDDPEPVRTVSEAIETPIRLSSIKTSGGEDILDWVKGRKYIYEIHIRYGGGISVTVTTSDWEEIKAGTPGLIIS